MDKIKLEFKTPENKTIEYNNVKIEVIPYIKFPAQIYIIDNYVKDYFGNPEDILIENTKYHYIEAEIRLRNYIIQLNTNIELKDINPEIYVDPSLWAKITNEIENYWDFRDTLETIVYDIKQQQTLENSVGKIVSDLVNKGYALLDKVASLNPEEIKEAGQKGLELVERLEKSSILNNPADKVVIAENSGLVQVEEKVIEKATEIKTRKPRAKKAK
jgi:hypothetical protein